MHNSTAQVCEPISIEKGVRQGDPISPYLFILVADLLQQMVQLAFNEGLLVNPVHEKKNQREKSAAVSVLQYADDTLIIIKGENRLEEILQAFSLFTGLQLYFSKSTLAPLHLEDDVADQISQLLGCPIITHPCTYLGLPLSMSKIPRKPVIQRILAG